MAHLSNVIFCHMHDQMRTEGSGRLLRRVQRAEPALRRFRQSRGLGVIAWTFRRPSPPRCCFETVMRPRDRWLWAGGPSWRSSLHSPRWSRNSRPMGPGGGDGDAIDRSAGHAAALDGCCDPITSNLYDASQTGDLPDAAVKASLGCGNPTALAELKPGEIVLDLGSGGGIDVLLSARRVGPDDGSRAAYQQ